MVVLNRTVSEAALAPVAPSAHLYQDYLHAHREQFGAAVWSRLAGAMSATGTVQAPAPGRIPAIGSCR